MRRKKTFEKIAYDDCESLRLVMIEFLKKNPLPSYILAPKIGISVNCLRSFLIGSRVTNYPQRNKIKKFLEQIGKK